jgi:putative oxidoreductase
MLAIGLLILRLVVGLTLAGHGAQKLFGWWGGSGMKGWTGMVGKLRIRPALAWAWVAALAEFAGGLLVALGLLFPIGSLAIAGSMLVAIATVHLAKGFWVTKGGYEFNLLILASVIALALTGPGKYSLDQLFGIRLPEPATLLVGAVAVAAGVIATLASRGPLAATESKPQTT